MTETMEPVSRTAYYCCGVRALDAAAPHPVCGDQYAQRFMTAEAWTLFEPFRNLRAPNACNVARHRIIDDLLRARLARHADTGVVIIGAGFDTRAFRMPGGRWIELDEPALMTQKERQLPGGEAPNPLARVAIRFGHDSLESALEPYRHVTDPVVVLEGVLPYLSAGEVRALLQAIRNGFSAPTLICDLTTPAFARSYGAKVGAILHSLGAPYGRLDVEPLPLIEEAGFRLRTRQSAIGAAAALGLLKIPRWLLATVLRSLRDGYGIASFDVVEGPRA